VNQHLATAWVRVATTGGPAAATKGSIQLRVEAYDYPPNGGPQPTDLVGETKLPIEVIEGMAFGRLTRFVRGIYGGPTSGALGFTGEIVGGLLFIQDIKGVAVNALAHSGWTDREPDNVELGLSVFGLVPGIGDAAVGTIKGVSRLASAGEASQLARRMVDQPLRQSGGSPQDIQQIAQDLAEDSTRIAQQGLSPQPIARAADSPRSADHVRTLVRADGGGAVLRARADLQQAFGEAGDGLLRAMTDASPRVVAVMGDMPQAEATALAGKMLNLIRRQGEHVNQLDERTLSLVLSNRVVHRLDNINELSPTQLERLVDSLTDLRQADGFGTLMRRLGHEVREYSQGQANNLKGATYELIVAAKVKAGQLGIGGQPTQVLMTSRFVRSSVGRTDVDVVYRTPNGLTEFVQCKATQTAPNLRELELWARKVVAYADEMSIPLDTVRIRLVTETGLSTNQANAWRDVVQNILNLPPDTLNLSDVMTVLPVAW